MKKGSKYVFIDYKVIGQKLTLHYRVMFNICMFLCLGSFLSMILLSKDKESVYYMLVGILTGFIAIILKKRLNEIENKIDELGIERAWEYFKGTSFNDLKKRSKNE